MTCEKPAHACFHGELCGDCIDAIYEEPRLRARVEELETERDRLSAVLSTVLSLLDSSDQWNKPGTCGARVKADAREVLRDGEVDTPRAERS